MDGDAVQFYPDVEQVNPGDTVRGFFTLLLPHKHVGKLVPGKMFLIREGQRVVAYGRVINILELEKSAQRSRDGGTQVKLQKD